MLTIRFRNRIVVIFFVVIHFKMRNTTMPTYLLSELVEAILR